MKNLPLMTRIIRYSWAKNDAKRDYGNTTPDDIERFDDINYGVSDNCLLDVYRPKNNTSKLPVIVNVHGGGWQYGDKKLYQWYCMNLAQRGFAVVNFTYHLAPEYPYPQFLKDTIAAFKFVFEKQDKYLFDIDHIYAVGDSAGAHILSMYINYGTNEQFRNISEIDDDFFLLPKALGLNCGLYGRKNNSLMAVRIAFFKRKRKDMLRLFETLPFMTKDFPPTFIISAKGDFLLNSQKPLKKRLDELGVYNELHVYGNAKKRLYHVFHVNIKEEIGKQANDEETNFFKKY